MRAVVFSEWQTFPTIETVDQPEPGPGEVLLKVAGAGACHSDVAVYKTFAEGTVKDVSYIFNGLKMRLSRNWPSVWPDIFSMM